MSTNRKCQFVLALALAALFVSGAPAPKGKNRFCPVPKANRLSLRMKQQADPETKVLPASRGIRKAKLPLYPIPKKVALNRRM